MVSTQIQLTDDQYRVLERLALARRTSIGELIQRSIEVFLRSEKEVPADAQKQRALAAVGRFRSGLDDLSIHHDRYLNEIRGE